MTRREAMGRVAVAGILFGGPAVLRAARRQIVIAGRRVKVVDGLDPVS